MENRAYKMRIYPTKEQQQLFFKTFGCIRKYWNLAVEQLYRQLDNHEPLSILYPAEAKKQYGYLREVDTIALANTQMQLQQAVRNWRNNPKHFHKPKFKSKKHERRSYTTSIAARNAKNVRIEGNHIRLPKAGLVKMKLHRNIPGNWKLKSATISQDVDGKWYVSVLFEYQQEMPQHAIDEAKSIGLDYKSDGFYVGSDGSMPGSPKYYRKSFAKIYREQYRLSRKRKGSRNYYKQMRRLGKAHVKARNRRKDFLHKLSAEIANQYDIVCIESLDMKAMANKGFGNGKATMDNAYGMFVAFLSYKMADRGKTLVKVGKFYPSSQICHCCGYQDGRLKDLRVRQWECPICGIQHDRDRNAAVNILQEGLRLYQDGIAVA